MKCFAYQHGVIFPGFQQYSITDEEYDKEASKPIAVRDNVDVLWGNVVLVERFEGYTNKNEEVWTWPKLIIFYLFLIFICILLIAVSK